MQAEAESRLWDSAQADPRIMAELVQSRVRPEAPVAAPTPTFAEVQGIVAQRCQMCHNAVVQSKNVRLDSAEAIRVHAQQVYQQAVVLRLMPMNNATAITEAERATIGRWFRAGAPTP